MNIRFNARYNTIAFYTLLVFAGCLLLIMVAFRIDIVSAAFSRIISVSAPVLWSLVIAYLLNPLMKLLEGLFSRVLNRKREHPRLIRGLAVAVSILLLLSALAGLIASIIPEIIRNIEAIGEMIQNPDFLDEMKRSIHGLFDALSKKTASLSESASVDFANTESMLLSALEKLEQSIVRLFSSDGFLTGLINRLMEVLRSVKDAFLGVILSAYLLSGKEHFLAQIRKIISALVPETRVERIFRFFCGVNQKFIRYFTGVALDCMLIGILTFLFMSVTDMPYALLISVLLAVTNAIPIFGPFIGSVPAAALILLFSPGKALLFLIFVVILQQVDGNLIAPRILGDQLGLSGFWIMSAVIIGGGLFGFAGMILATPLFAVFYSIFSEYVRARLEKRHLPVSTQAYMAPSQGNGRKKEPPDRSDGNANNNYDSFC